MARYKVHKSYKWMYRMYVVKRMTEEEIAKIADVDQATISRWLKRHELKK